MSQSQSQSTETCYVDSFCCCIKLKTGCFILGYTGLVGIILAIIISVLGIITIISFGEKDGKVRDIVPMFVLVTSVLLVFLVLGLVFNIVLLVGLHNDKPGHVKAYLIFNTVFLIIFIVLLVASILLGYTDPINIISKTFQTCATIYFLVVIRSHYLKMKDPFNETV